MESAFELKSTRLSALAVHFATADLTALRNQLAGKSEAYRMFAHTALVADFTGIRPEDLPDLAELKNLFAQFGLHLVAVRNLSADGRTAAEADGWLCVHGEAADGNESQTADNGETAAADDTPAADEAASAASVETTEISEAAAALPVARPTVVVDTPVRTGQQVYAEHADLIVLGMVSEGAEVIADGNIHIYAPMRGRALAGEKGDKSARIFMQSMQAELVSVAGIYRVFEQDLPAHLHKQPVRIELVEDRLAVSAIDAH